MYLSQCNKKGQARECLLWPQLYTTLSCPSFQTKFWKFMILLTDLGKTLPGQQLEETGATAKCRLPAPPYLSCDQDFKLHSACMRILTSLRPVINASIMRGIDTMLRADSKDSVLIILNRSCRLVDAWSVGQAISLKRMKTTILTFVKD